MSDNIMITIEQVMTYMLRNSVTGLPPASLAEVFDRLIWCLADNGEGLLNVRKDWLECNDPAKIEVALNMSETFPYDTREEMIRKFREIKDSYPRLTDRCNEIIRMWDQQFSVRSVPRATDEAILF
jgi:hypothetical protein